MRLTKGLLLPMLLAVSSAFAQKQTENAQAPAVVRIDGKINEWTEPFQVNKPTKLSYLIANDQRNLYLVIKSEDSLTNTRIMLTGMEFMINTDGKKKEGPMVSFPLFDKMSSLVVPGEKPLAPDALNKKKLAEIKEIKLTRFKDITEPTISIYNEYGIKGAAALDDKKNFIYEMAIPLNVLGLTPETTNDIAYNIKINGSANAQFVGGGDRGFGGGGFPGGGERVVVINGGGDRGGFPGGGRFDQNRFYEATDFWVDLKLAKPKK